MNYSIMVLFLDSLNNSMGLSDDVINNSELETPTNGTQLNTIQENGIIIIR